MIFNNIDVYVACNISSEDIAAVENCELRIVRCSDQKELLPDGEWDYLEGWPIYPLI